jgi:hypothetical protein
VTATWTDITTFIPVIQGVLECIDVNNQPISSIQCDSVWLDLYTGVGCPECADVAIAVAALSPTCSAATSPASCGDDAAAPVSITVTIADPPSAGTAGLSFGGDLEGEAPSSTVLTPTSASLDATTPTPSSFGTLDTTSPSPAVSVPFDLDATNAMPAEAPYSGSEGYSTGVIDADSPMGVAAGTSL